MTPRQRSQILDEVWTMLGRIGGPECVYEGLRHTWYCRSQREAQLLRDQLLRLVKARDVERDDLFLLPIERVAGEWVMAIEVKA